jgi:hypothetical protein
MVVVFYPWRWNKQCYDTFLEKEENTHTQLPLLKSRNFLTLGKVGSQKLTYTLAELDQIRSTIKAADAYIDKKMKGLKIEANEKERVKAEMLKEDIAEWLVESGKYEQRESIKQVPISLLRQAIGAIKEIKDKRSISNQIDYLKTYKQIDQIGLSGKQYRFLG